MNRLSERHRRWRTPFFFSALAWVAGCGPDRAASELRSGSLRESAEASEPRRWFPSQLHPTDERPDIRFGYDVDASETSVVVGAPGAKAAYVFELAADGWHQRAKLEAPSDASPAFARVVAISNDTVVVGAPPEWPGAPHVGKAYVYVREGTNWSGPTTLSRAGGVPDDEFAADVAISGDTIVVGAPGEWTGVTEDGYEGAVYVFTRSGSAWAQTSKLFLREDAGRNSFGQAVAVSASTVLVGVPLWLGGGSLGAAFFFSHSGTGWGEPQKFELGFTGCCDYFGASVALGDEIAVIGAPWYKPREPTPELQDHQGAAFTFTRSSSSWSMLPEPLFAEDPKAYDEFGAAVAASGSTVMVGAPGNGTDFWESADSVYVFSPLTSARQEARIGERNERPMLGGSVGLDGDVAAIGSLHGRNGAFVAELLLPDGEACSMDSECRARHCVDGVCCDRACSGDCEECSSGTCATLPDRPAVPACGPYLCRESNGACPETCAAHGDCVDTHYCRDGVCLDRVPNGGHCTEARHCLSETCADGRCSGTIASGRSCRRASDCASGFCVDGYCCNEACVGQCEACDVSGSRGTCAPVEDGSPHGDRPTCEGPGTVCAGKCDGVHTARCTYPAVETACGSTCAADVQTPRTCNGRGACEDGLPIPCEPYRCAGDTECKQECDDEEQDCAQGFTCSNGICEAGATCKDDHTVQLPDGDEKDCVPYRCVEGDCQGRCEVPNDCFAGYTCDGEACVLAPAQLIASNDSGCSVSRSRSSHASLLFGVFAFALLGRRRVFRTRRRRTSG